MLAHQPRVPLTRKSISLTSRDAEKQQQECSNSSPINPRLARSISVNITTRPQSGNSPVIQITSSRPESRSSKEIRRDSASSISLPPRKIKFEHAIPNSLISDDETTSTLTLPSAITHEELRALILDQAAVPPKPLIRIKGVRGDRKWSSRSVTLDFDIRINAASLLTKDLANTVVHDHEEPTMSSDLHVHDSSTPPNTQFLDHQIKHFLSDLTPHKMLIMRREVKNWDTEYLHSQLLSIITTATTTTTGNTTSTETRPKIEITFPITYHKIILQQKAKRPTMHRMSSSSISITSTLSNLTMTSRSRTTSTSTTNTNFSSTSSSSSSTGLSSSRSNSDSKTISEHYITTSTWSYATTPPLSSSSPATRQCAVWSEHDWLLQWRDLIISAVRKGRVGWLGSDEYTEGLVSLRSGEGRKGWVRWWQ